MDEDGAEQSAEELLSRAAAAYRSGEVGEARDALVVAWRLTRHPAIADLVDALSARLPRDAIQGRTKREQRANWLAVAVNHDPTDLPALLATPWPPKQMDARDWVKELSSFPADPRIARVLTDILTSVPYKSSTAYPLYNAMLRVLKLHRDPRSVPRLKTIATREMRYGSTLQSRVKNDLRTLETRAKAAPLSETARASLDAFADEARQKQSAEELFERVYGALSEDAPRLVYADFLSAKGDPRGEYISLALSRGDAPPSRRERALLKTHAVEWSGPLDPLFHAKGRVWRRGFLAGGNGIWRRMESADRTATCREWAMIEEITLYGSVGAISERLAPAVRDTLRALHNVDLLFFGRQAGAPFALTTLSIYDGIDAPLGPQFQNVKVLGYVTPVHMTAHDSFLMTPPSWLFRDEVGAQLDEFQVLTARPVETTAMLMEHSRSDWKRVRVLDSKQVTFTKHKGWTYTLDKDGAGRFRVLRARFQGGRFDQGDKLISLVRGLPPDTLSEVHVETEKRASWPESSIERLETAMGRHPSAVLKTRPVRTLET